MPCDRQLEQHLVFQLSRRGRQEGVVQRRMGFVRLLVDELAAHAMPSRQIADCRRSRQRLNGQVLTITLGQPRCRSNVSIPTRTIPKQSFVVWPTEPLCAHG